MRHWRRRFLGASVLISACIGLTNTNLVASEATREVVVEIRSLPELTDDTLLILSKCVYAEAGNQGEDGMRYVCDVILNRVLSPDFPDTVEGVISQRHQFASYSDGGMLKHIPTDECVEICRQEYRG